MEIGGWKKKFPRITSCCSAAVWTKIIAVLEIIAFFIAGVKGTFFLVRHYRAMTSLLLTPPTRETLTVAQAKENLDFGDVAYPPIVYVVRLIFILLFVLLPGIVLAVLLLYGSVKRQPIYMTAWTVHAILCLILYTLMAAVMGTFLKGLVRLALFTFALWVVQVHKRELELEEDERSTLRPGQTAAAAAAAGAQGGGHRGAGRGGQRVGGIPPPPVVNNNGIHQSPIIRRPMVGGPGYHPAVHRVRSAGPVPPAQHQHQQQHHQQQQQQQFQPQSPPHWKYGSHNPRYSAFANVV